MIYSSPQTITIDSLQIKYRLAGSGPDVLMVHGWASSSRMWQRLMNDLAVRYRCLALDLPGFGESDKPADNWFSMERFRAVVTQAADALGLSAPVVIGHSMGGTIALSLATTNFPLSRVVAINPIVTGRSYWDLRLLSNSPLGAPMLSLGRWVWPIASGDWAGPWLGKERAGHFRRQREEWLQSTPNILQATLRVVGHTDLTPHLPRVAVPTLVLLGNRDMTAPNAEGKLAARTIPGAELVVLPSGHLPTDDLPERTLSVLEKFLVREAAPVS
jgi:pimeloyl-ACP methyl ester carboxylesterase